MAWHATPARSARELCCRAGPPKADGHRTYLNRPQARIKAAQKFFNTLLNVCRSFDHRMRGKELLINLQADAGRFQRSGEAVAIDTKRRPVDQRVAEQVVA